MNIPKKELDLIKKDPQKIEETTNEIFKHYRENGFPFFNLNSDEKLIEFNKVKKYDYSNIHLNGDPKTIKQIMHGLSLAWNRFPHAFDVKCGKMRTPMEVFTDDEMFRKVITKRIKLGDNISDNGIRKMLKVFSGTQAVSNFRPTTAKFIYDKFAGDGVVYDMSSGFGGRLVGAMASDRVKEYIGVEPSTRTFEGLQKLILDLKEDCGIDKKIQIQKTGSEVFSPKALERSVDLCFTSPPYFDMEKYSDEDTQSYIKFPTRQKWMDEFLMKTMDNCYDMLKDDGYLIVNIADVRTYPDLCNDFLERMSIKWDLKDTYKYALSGLFKYGFKYEPIYVFKKIC